MKNKNIIAIESSTKLYSIAILYSKKIYTKYKFLKKQENPNILLYIDKLLNINNIKLKNINLILINKGPGSIIGIRLSHIISQIFKFKFPKIKIKKIPSFKIIAENYYQKKKKKIIILIVHNYAKILYSKYKNNKLINIKIIDIEYLLKKIKKIKSDTDIITNSEISKKKLIYYTKKKIKNLKIYYPKAFYMINLFTIKYKKIII